MDDHTTALGDCLISSHQSQCLIDVLREEFIRDPLTDLSDVNKSWTEFVARKRLGVQAHVSDLYNIQHTIIDPHQWCLTRLRYGI